MSGDISVRGGTIEFEGSHMARKTGPDKRTVDLVHNRSAGICEVCGWAEGQQLHHRCPRRAGGTRDKAINAPSNLIFLCHLCHASIESHRVKAINDGHLISQFNRDGADEVPLLYRGTWRALDNEGGFVTIDRAD